MSGEGSWPEPPLQWELWVPLPQEEGQVCTRRSGDLAGDDLPQLRKSEPVYTPDIELLLDALQEPLNVVHTVDPREAERNYEKWMPAIHKEVGVIEKADTVCGTGLCFRFQETSNSTVPASTL